MSIYWIELMKQLWVECARKLQVAMNQRGVVDSDENRSQIRAVAKDVFPKFTDEEISTIVQVVIGGIDSVDLHSNQILASLVQAARTLVTVDEFHEAARDGATIKCIGENGGFATGTKRFNILLDNGFELIINAVMNEEGQPHLEFSASKGAYLLIG